MTLYHVQEVYRAHPAGTGLNGVTVTARLQSSFATIIASGTTATVSDEDGVIQLSLADAAVDGESSYVLHPGPYILTGTADGISVTRRQSSTTTGTLGALSIPAMAILNRAIGNGLVSAPPFGLNTGEVTAAGAERVVSVDTFGGTIQGLPFWNDVAREVNISANSSGNPRIDTVVVEMIPAGNATEGRCVLKVVEGTPASSPVAPTLTQSTTAWQLPLADVAVANGASVITTGNLTDRRDFVERSVTAVEGDVVQLQADVLALQTPVVPRMQLIGYYSGIWDPANLPAGSTETTTVSIQFVSGYSSLLVTDTYLVDHFEIRKQPFLNLVATIASSTQVIASVRNLGTGAYNPQDSSLVIRVLRLITS